MHETLRETTTALIAAATHWRETVLAVRSRLDTLSTSMERLVWLRRESLKILETAHDSLREAENYLHMPLIRAIYRHASPGNAPTVLIDYITAATGLALYDGRATAWARDRVSEIGDFAAACALFQQVCEQLGNEAIEKLRIDLRDFERPQFHPGVPVSTASVPFLLEAELRFLGPCALKPIRRALPDIRLHFLDFELEPTLKLLSFISDENGDLFNGDTPKDIAEQWFRKSDPVLTFADNLKLLEGEEPFRRIMRPLDGLCSLLNEVADHVIEQSNKTAVPCVETARELHLGSDSSVDWSEPMTITELADRFGFSRNTMSSWLKRPGSNGIRSRQIGSRWQVDRSTLPRPEAQ